MKIDVLQSKASEKFTKLKVGALFMKAGSGKTKVATSLLKQKEKSYDCVIWIAPASLLNSQNYQDTTNRWKVFYNFDKPIYYYTAEGISASDDKFLEMRSIAEKNKCFCVIDESLKIKNLVAKKTKRLLQMADLFEFKLILNGTPVTKGLYDLYPQIQFLSPKILNMTEREFAHKFLEFKNNDSYRAWTQWSKPHNEQALIEMLRPYIFDEDLEKYSEIKTFQRNIPFQKHIEYENKKQELFELMEKEGAAFSFFGMMQILKQLYETTQEAFIQLQSDVEAILQRREKVIVYVSFLKQVDKIVELFGEDQVAVFTGQEKMGLEEFKKTKDIMVSTYGCGSVGLNLQFCNNIIYFSQTFNYADKEQSLHRIYRFGQEKTCNIINYICDTGLCKLITMSLNKKQNILINIKNFIITNSLLNL
jgi:SNF2 family DNA or RNA helicase